MKKSLTHTEEMVFSRGNSKDCSGEKGSCQHTQVLDLEIAGLCEPDEGRLSVENRGIIIWCHLRGKVCYVLVTLDFCNKALGLLVEKTFFLPVLESGLFKTKVLAYSTSDFTNSHLLTVS